MQVEFRHIAANAEVGAVVAPGTMLAELYSNGEIEVRLSLSGLFVDEKNRILLRDVRVLRTNEMSVLIGEGLETGDRVVLTRLVSLAFGSLFSTVIMLFLVPGIYLILEDIKNHAGKKFRKSSV